MSWYLPHELRRSCYRILRPARYRKIRAIPKSERKSELPSAQLARPDGLFIHIPKCAGVSVSESLFGERTSRHTTIMDYLLVFSEEEFNRLFKFTIVRNPWDRLVSAFVYLKQGGANESDRAWSERHLSRFADFDQFVKGWVGRGNVERALHFRPQVRFLCGPRSLRPLVDFVGYFETLADDFAAIAEKLGIVASLTKSNMTINKADDYKSYYTAATRSIVGEVYRDDIEIFGYEFDTRREASRYGTIRVARTRTK